MSCNVQWLLDVQIYELSFINNIVDSVVIQAEQALTQSNVRGEKGTLAKQLYRLLVYQLGGHCSAFTISLLG